MTEKTTPIDKIELPYDFMSFDIETGPLPDDQLMRLCPAAKLPKHPGEFILSGVKLGNLKDPLKIQDKIDAAFDSHQAAVGANDDACVAAIEQNFAAFRDKAALSATTGRVVAIGVAESHGIDIIGDGQESEEFILSEFWGTVTDCLKFSISMIGFNTKGFDLPFLIRRSWMLGVPIPAGVRQGRYWNDLFVDLMEVWNQGERGYVKLDVLCTAFGLPGKVVEVDGVEISGATFHEVWNSESRDVAVEYLRGDILLPVELARRMRAV